MPSAWSAASFEDPDFRDDPSLIGNNRTDPTTRLTLSKRLSSQVEFTVSQNLRESGNTTFIISYLRDAATSRCGRCRATTTPSASAFATR